MLRKMRLTAPADRFEDLLAAARAAHIELDDWCVDTPEGLADYGWPLTGDGSAVVLAVVDDTQETGPELEQAMRAAHTQLTGEDASWITFAKSYVFFPDALEGDFYDTYGPLAAQLHAAEDAGDTLTAAGLREQIEFAVTLGLQQANEFMADFTDRLVTAGVIPIDQVARPLTVQDIHAATAA